MDHNLGLACCVAGVCVLGLLGLIGPIIRIRRFYVGRKKVSEARGDALDEIRRLLDPAGQGLVSGSPDHFYVRVGAAQIEVKLTTYRTDSRFGTNQPQALMGDVEVIGHTTLRAAWHNGRGPVFKMHPPARATPQPASFDEAYEVEGAHAALVRGWFLGGPLDGAAAQIYPQRVSSDGATVTINGRGASASGDRLAAAVRVLAAMLDAAAG